MMKIFLMLAPLIVSTNLFAKGRLYRQYVGGFGTSNVDSQYENGQGGYLSSEFDYAGGYLSKAQSISYYEASSLEDGAIIDAEAPAKWMSDIVLSSFHKLRLPASTSFISIYGNVGLDVHLGYRQLSAEPDQFKTNWAVGWNYGGGVELRIKRLCIDARVNFRRIFGGEFTYLDTDEILVGIGWQSSY